MDFTHDLTAVSGSVLTAAQWNTNVRDNLLQTAPALATAAGQVFVSTAANTLAARNLSSVYVGALETTTSTTFGNLSTFGPWTKFATGPSVLVGLSAQVWNSASAWSLMSYVMTYGTTARGQRRQGGWGPEHRRGRSWGSDPPDWAERRPGQPVHRLLPGDRRDRVLGVPAALGDADLVARPPVTRKGP